MSGKEFEELVGWPRQGIEEIVAEVLDSEGKKQFHREGDGVHRAVTI